MRTAKQLIKFGNSKLPTTTMILDMGSSQDCPSRKLGLCKVVNEYGENGCYARQPELFRKACLPRRNACADYWLNTSKEDILKDLERIIVRKRVRPNLFRFNEVGDFYSQDCVNKLNYIAYHLYNQFGIITYGYTARKDLDYNFIVFRLKGSGYDIGNNGQTVVVRKTDTDTIEHYKSLGYKVCPGNCKKCSLCSSKKGYCILFIKH